jgi:hypothetical protein
LNIMKWTLGLHLTIIIFSHWWCDFFHTEEKIFIFWIEFISIFF